MTKRRSFSSGLWIKSRKKTKEDGVQLGWDEDKCRLIYSSQESTEEELDKIRDTNASPQGDTFNDSTEDEATVCPATVSDGPTKRQRRQFGSKKPRKPVDILDFQAKENEIQIENQKDKPPQTTTSLQSSDDEDITEDPKSPQPKRVSIEKETDLDFPSIKQLSGSTALDQAKEYFAQLDERPLALEQQRTPKKEPQRTTRRVSIGEFQQEYETYQKACQESNVTPFSPNKFLKDRHDLLPQKSLKAFLDV